MASVRIDRRNLVERGQDPHLPAAAMWSIYANPAGHTVAPCDSKQEITRREAEKRPDGIKVRAKVTVPGAGDRKVNPSRVVICSSLPGWMCGEADVGSRLKIAAVGGYRAAELCEGPTAKGS
jgi:hypothetical protein